MGMTGNDTGTEEAETGGVVVVWDLLNMEGCLGLGFTRSVV
jgi:hypothetical protein